MHGGITIPEAIPLWQNLFGQQPKHEAAVMATDSFIFCFQDAKSILPAEISKGFATDEFLVGRTDR